MAKQFNWYNPILVLAGIGENSEHLKGKKKDTWKYFLVKRGKSTVRLQKQIPTDILLFIAMLLIGDSQTIYCGRPDNCIMEVWLAHPGEYCSS